MSVITVKFAKTSLASMTNEGLPYLLLF